MAKTNKHGITKIESLKLAQIRSNLNLLEISEEDQKRNNTYGQVLPYEEVKKLSQDDIISYIHDSICVDPRISFEVLKTAIKNKDSEIIIPVFAILQLTYVEVPSYDKSKINKVSVLNLILHAYKNEYVMKTNIYGKRSPNTVEVSTPIYDRIEKCMKYLNHTLDYELYSLGEELPNGTYLREYTKTF